MVNKQFATAVQLMAYLATSPEEQQNSELLSRTLRTNAVVIRRLLAKLNKAGLVKTTRGKAGGVQLGRKAQGINLSEIYQAVTCTRMLKCNEKPAVRDCPVSCTLTERMKGIVEGVESASMEYLAHIKLSEFVKGLKH